jgi:hypothetical protein
MLRRIDQLNRWTEDLVTPVCLWLPGLFNPTAYLTAVMQVRPSCPDLTPLGGGPHQTTGVEEQIWRDRWRVWACR